MLNADFQERIYCTKRTIVTRSQKGKWTCVRSLTLITCPKNKVNSHNLTEPYSWSALTRVILWSDDTSNFWGSWCWKICIPYSNSRNSLSPKWSGLWQIHRAVRSNSYKSILPAVHILHTMAPLSRHWLDGYIFEGKMMTSHLHLAGHNHSPIHTVNCKHGQQWP